MLDRKGSGEEEVRRKRYVTVDLFVCPLSPIPGSVNGLILIFKSCQSAPSTAGESTDIAQVLFMESLT